MILHITLPEDWAAARAAGRYTASTRGASIAEVGFLHASGDARQVALVGRAVYADRPDAFVVGLDEGALDAAGLEVRREPGDPRDPDGERFPHVYGGPVPVALMRPIPSAPATFQRCGHAGMSPECWGPGSPPRGSGSEVRVLREDDAEAARLQDAGWTVRSTSWGARLYLDAAADLTRYEGFLAAAEEHGLVVRRLEAARLEDCDVAALRALDAAAAPDFPNTPASRHEPLPDDLGELLVADEWRAYGALDADADAQWAGDSLVGFSLLKRAGERWEVDRTAVRAGVRRQGVGRAVRSAAILDTHREGGRAWGTGGAGVNTASRRMNEALGFEFEPLWLALVRPATWEEFDVARFWAQARSDVEGLPEEPPAAWAFGGAADEADALLALVLSGVKTATASAAQDYAAQDYAAQDCADQDPAAQGHTAQGQDLPRTGDLWIVLDGAGVPRAVLETTEVDVVPFAQVTPEHAHAEGEGDRSLAAWRAEHERFWRRHSPGGFAADMPVVCERFRVVFPALCVTPQPVASRATR